jgi:hypothetical protein
MRRERVGKGRERGGESHALSSGQLASSVWQNRLFDFRGANRRTRRLILAESNGGSTSVSTDSIDEKNKGSRKTKGTNERSRRKHTNCR